jgi:uncharacterized protein (DUF1501 family)
MDRRRFLKQTGIITAGTLLVPSFLRANGLLNGFERNGKRLVIIQLSGGNDGLNTVVPYGIDAYHQNRNSLAYQLSEILKVNEKFGLHPALKGFYDLQQKGHLSIINSVGYPNPNRSHFRSMDIWHTGSDANEYWSSGWLGRYLDKNCNHAYEAIEFSGELSLAMKGEHQAGIAISNPNAFYKTMNSEFFQQMTKPKSKNEELNYVYRIFNDTRNSAEYIYDQYRLKENRSDYANHNFGQQLKKIATLIKSDIRTPVFYASLGGFDTHVNQKNSQNRLLGQLDSGVSDFINDLSKEGLMKDTTVLIFSEFGRRLKENASRGTDHGAANALFIIDSDLSSNAHSLNNIDLDNLEKGDPKFQVDFRSIYQELLSHRLKVDAKAVLGKTFDGVGLFA